VEKCLKIIRMWFELAEDQVMLDMLEVTLFGTMIGAIITVIYAFVVTTVSVVKLSRGDKLVDRLLEIVNANP